MAVPPPCGPLKGLAVVTAGVTAMPPCVPVIAAVTVSVAVMPCPVPMVSRVPMKAWTP